MTDRLYFWLFNRLAQNPKRPVTIWAWRKLIVCLEIRKHVKRGNWRQAAIYLRML